MTYLSKFSKSSLTFSKGKPRSRTHSAALHKRTPPCRRNQQYVTRLGPAGIVARRDQLVAQHDVLPLQLVVPGFAVARPL